MESQDVACPYCGWNLFRFVFGIRDPIVECVKCSGHYQMSTVEGRTVTLKLAEAKTKGE